MSGTDALQARRNRSSTVAMYGLESTELQTINYLRKEAVRMRSELATLKSKIPTGTVYGSTILVVGELLKTVEGRVRMLTNQNEQTQSALKNINEIV